MLTPEEQKRVLHYSTKIIQAGGDLSMLSSEESRELASLVDKWIQQVESHSGDQGKSDGGAEKLLPMPPDEGPPLPKMFTIRWPWRKD